MKFVEVADIVVVGDFDRDGDVAVTSVETGEVQEAPTAIPYQHYYLGTPGMGFVADTLMADIVVALVVVVHHVPFCELAALGRQRWVHRDPHTR